MNKTPFTLFWDMHSGGGTKEPPYEKIYIQAPEEQAKVIFYNRFGHNPERISCTCCGEDYSISESETLEQASGYHRNCDYSKDGFCVEKSRENGGYISVDNYIQMEDVLVIFEEDINPEERKGKVPVEGYVWI